MIYFLLCLSFSEQETVEMTKQMKPRMKILPVKPDPKILNYSSKPMLKVLPIKPECIHNNETSVTDVPAGCSELIIKHCEFVGISNPGNVGSAISLNKPNVSALNITIEDSLFVSCSADVGGAIYMYFNNINLKILTSIRNSSFTDCSAKFNYITFFIESNNISISNISISGCFCSDLSRNWPQIGFYTGEYIEIENSNISGVANTNSLGILETAKKTGITKFQNLNLNNFFVIDESNKGKLIEMASPQNGNKVLNYSCINIFNITNINSLFDIEPYDSVYLNTVFKNIIASRINNDSNNNRINFYSLLPNNNLVYNVSFVNCYSTVTKVDVNSGVQESHPDITKIDDKTWKIDPFGCDIPTIIPTETFSHSSDFSESDYFSPSACLITQSNTYTPSNTFTPSSKFTPSLSYYVERDRLILMKRNPSASQSYALLNLTVHQMYAVSSSTLITILIILVVLLLFVVQSQQRKRMANSEEESFHGPQYMGVTDEEDDESHISIISYSYSYSDYDPTFKMAPEDYFDFVRKK